jgi:PAS domain S-box-containing protein
VTTNPATKISTNVELLLESVGVGMWRWDGANNAFALDATCRQIFGLSADEEIDYQLLAKLLHPDDLDRYREALQTCLETGSFFVEYRIILSDGETRFLSGRGHALPHLPGDAPVIRGVFIDVTEHRNLEDQLRHSESRMQQLADGLPGLFCYINKEYRVQFMNSRYRNTIGVGEDEWFDRHIGELVGMDAFEDRKGRYDRALAGESVIVETDKVMPDGKHRHFTVTHHPHKNDAGEILGAMTLAMDITDRRTAEQELESKTRELARSNHDLEQFAYVASHDLKAPLRAIEVLVEWLRDDLADYAAGEVQENLSLLKQRTRRLNRLLDDLLTYSSAGRKVGEVQQTNCRTMVSDIATLLSPPDGMSVVADESLPTIFAHRAPLEQVLRNLINNAIKHHPAKTGRIHVYAKDLGAEIMFAVEDDGAGIPEKYKAKVFQMFQTLQPRDEREGSGMGLAIVKRIIEWQGGRIWFHPGPDETGTVFKFVWNKVPAETQIFSEDELKNERTEDESRQHLAG